MTVGEAAAGTRTRRANVPSILVIGAAIVGFWVIVAVTWRWWVPFSPTRTNVLDSLQGPSRAHWLGTDKLGRDVFSRVMAGSADTLTVAPLATALALLIGVGIGMTSAYAGGWRDQATARIIDGMLSFPVIVLIVLVVSVAGKSRLTLVVVIGLLFAPLVARTARALTLSEGSHDYVASARLLGLPAHRILARETLPNVSPSLVVEATVRLGYAVFAEATLSFLGLGLQPPSPAWGVSVADNRSSLAVAPWTVLAPAVAIASLVVAVNLVADGMVERREL